MGSVGTKVIKPVISGPYKATQEMKDIATDMYERFQKDFPIITKDTPVEIIFDKYMGSDTGRGFMDKIYLNGAYLKKKLNDRDGQAYMEGLIAHELTHSVQARISQLFRLYGDKYDSANDIMWNNVVDRFVKDNPKYTKADINRIVASDYGGGHHTRTGSSATEKMAVVVEHVYGGYNDISTRVGHYMVEELKRVLS